MHQITITAIDHKACQYWAVSGIAQGNTTERMRLIQGAYFSRSQQCWLILRNQIDKNTLLAILSPPVSDDTVPTEETLAHIYQSTWRVLAPLNPASIPQFRLPKSAKYRCAIRMLYSYDLSLRQLCSIELVHISWGTCALEIRIPASPEETIVLTRVTTQLVTEYLQQALPEKYLFETQPGQAYPEEKLHRCLVSYIPGAPAIHEPTRTVSTR